MIVLAIVGALALLAVYFVGSILLINKVQQHFKHDWIALVGVVVMGAIGAMGIVLAGWVIL